MSAVVTPATPTDQVNIEIDGVATTAKKGSMIIQAADRLGVSIPRFCYHDKLTIAANCRMCLVDVEKAPKPMPACATPVMEGMKVFTQSKRALDSQRNVMEFLLINHPLDCPVCDQGGECELQDVAMGYGQSVSRFVERKRVVADEDLGPLVATDMTRCIHCTRCVRFVAEIAGTYELGGMSRGENLSIGTYIGKNIGSELSGNIIDVCPVGALTNKPFRFRARAWELTARPSIGYHDALGSNLYLHLRRGEVLRTVPRDNESLNESWLSDRDRYSHAGLSADDRVMSPMLRDGDGGPDSIWREASWDEALTKVAAILKSTPAERVGMLVHPATSNEEGALLARLAKGIGTGNLDHRLHELDFADAPVAQPFAATLADVEAADCVLLVGCNPRLEAPILGHRLRKAWKRGAKIAAINPLAFDLHFELAQSLITTPSGMVDAMLAVTRELTESGSATPPAGFATALGAASKSDQASAIAAMLRDAGRVVVILGESAQSHPNASWLRGLARHLAETTGALISLLPQGANAIGLARHGVLPSAMNVAAMLGNELDTYLLYGIEPALDFANGGQAQRALAKAPNVIAFAAYAPQALKDVAAVILPIGLLPEIEATLTNAHGVEQTLPAAAKVPGNGRPGWRVLRALGGQLGFEGFGFEDVSGLRDSMLELQAVPSDGVSERSSAGEGLQRISTTPIYRSDAVVRRAAPLQAHVLNQPAFASFNPADAQSLGIKAGQMTRVDDGVGSAMLPAVVSDSVPVGAVWIERGHMATAPLACAGAALRVEQAKG